MGRKAGNDLYFNRPEVSGSHAAFLSENGEYFIMDLGSTNGTLLNGAQIKANAKYPFKEKDVVTINPFQITLEVAREISATVLDQLPPVNSMKRGGTMLDLDGRVSTGTDPGDSRALAIDQPAAPVEEPNPATPADNEHAAPLPPAPVEAEQPLAESTPVVVKKGGIMGVLLWLIVGGVFLLLALGLIVFLLMGV